MFTIENMRNVPSDWTGKKLASFSIRCNFVLNGATLPLVIKSCSLFQGPDGLFIKGPSSKRDKPYTHPKTGKVEDYFDYLFIDRKTQDCLIKIVSGLYDANRDGLYPETVPNFSGQGGEFTSTTTGQSIDDIPA